MLKSDDTSLALPMTTLRQFFADKSADNPGYIVIFHDEASFAQNDVSTFHWFDVNDGPALLRPKSNGANVMVSDFVIEHLGWVKEKRVVFKTAKGNYWNHKRFMKQVKAVEAHLTAKYFEFAGNGFNF